MNLPGMHQSMEDHAGFAREVLRDGVMRFGRSACGWWQTVELALERDGRAFPPSCVLWFRLGRFEGGSRTLVIGWVHTHEVVERYGLATKLLTALESVYSGCWFRSARATEKSRGWLVKNGFVFDAGADEWRKLVPPHRFDAPRETGGVTP